jgi:non-ribosomal peptide synthase protein (TIGR01720 family)
VCLAKYYINNKDLTTLRFIHIKDGYQVVRLYLSGDRGIRHPSGVIQYLGRMDLQVKIHGYRIELEEIEHRILEKAQECIVVALDQKIIAFYSECSCSEETLKTHLAAFLPSYMVPHRFIKKRGLPKMSSGKVDRNTLINEYQSSSQVIPSHSSNSSSLETQLIGLAASVLKKQSIGPNNNFFSLGGDSISALQLISKARKKNIHFKLKDLFKYPTMAELATVAKKGEKQKRGAPLEGFFPLTPIQHWLIHHPLEDYWNQTLVLESSRLLCPNTVKKAIELLIGHHEGLRLRYAHDKQLQHYGEPSYQFSNLEPFDLSALQKCIHPEKGPLLQVVLSSCKKKLGFIASHFFIDGVSWRIFLEDFESTYRKVENHKPITFPSKTDSYKQWAEELEMFAKNPQLKKEVPFWIKSLEQAQLLEKNDVCYRSMQTVFGGLNTQETKELLSFAHHPLHDLLVTGFAEALSHTEKHSQPTFNIEGHGRENIVAHSDVSRTIGWFTSIYPVSFSIKDPKDHKKNLQFVQNHLKTLPNKGVGYGILKYLSKNKELAQCQEPDVLFNFLGQWHDPSSLFTILGTPGFDDIGGDQKIQYRLLVNGLVSNGCLKFAMTYHPEVSECFVNDLLKNFFKNLKELSHEVS